MNIPTKQSKSDPSEGARHRGHASKMSIGLATVALLAGACGSSAGSKQAAKTSSAPYKIGSSGDLSGPLASIGTALRNGYQLYFSQVNAGGGIKGHPVNLTALDDRSDPTQGVANVKQLIETDHVSGTLIFLSNVITAAAPVLNAANTPAVVQAATGALLHPVEPEIFAGDIIIGDEPAPSIAFLSTKMNTSALHVGVITALTAALSAYAANAVKESEQHGWDVVRNEQVSLSATTAGPQATVLAAGHPQAVLMALTDPLAISAVQTLRQQGFTGPIINYDGGSGYATLSKLKDPDFYVVRPFPYATGGANMGPLLSKFANEAHTHGLDPTQPFLLNGYLQAWVIGQGLKACGYPCSPKQLTTALDSLSNLNTGGLTYGPWVYTKRDHAGIENVEIDHWDATKNQVTAASGLLPIKSD